MERAAARLREGTAIKAIAGQCGYATEAAFTHAFRRWAGVPPGAFRTRPATAPPPVTPADRS
jgi:AraC-like DNA-binding protein